MILAAACTGETKTVPSKVGNQIFLWKATHPDYKSSIYLFGTIHTAKKDTMDLAVKQAMDASDNLFLEVDTSNSVNTTEMTEFVKKHGLLPPGKTLKDLVRPGLMKYLKKACEGLGISTQKFERMRPWLAAVLLTSINSALEGSDLEKGKEAWLTWYARKRNMKILSLETSGDQLAIFSGTKPDIEEALLADSVYGVIKDLKYKGSKNKSGIDKTYEQGDLKGLEDYFFSNEMKKSPLAPLMKKLLDDRNIKMVENIIKAAKTPGRYLVAVGAGHYPGKMGILKLLENKGFTITRIPPGGEYTLKMGTSKKAKKRDLWTKITDPLTGVSFSMYGTYDLTKGKQETEIGTVYAKTYQSTNVIWVSVVNIFDFPETVTAATLEPSVKYAFLDSMVIALINEISGKIIYKKNTTVNNLPGIFYKVKIPDGYSNFLTVIHGSIVVIIQTSSIGRFRGKDNRPDLTKKLFNSIKIDDLTKNKKAPVKKNPTHG